MEWNWATAIAAATITFLYLLHQWRRSKKNLPPGPRGLPIIGHFHLLSKNPHHDLHRLARKHGPIMYTRFGSVPTVVVSSPAAAELFLKAHDLKFADRPHTDAGYYFSYEQRDITFGRYGPYWRNMRKLCTLELLSGLKIAQFQPMRAAEIGILVASLKEAATAAAREAVDMSVSIASASADMTCLMVFGRKFEGRDLDERGFKEVMTEAMVEAGAFNVGDYFPYLRWMDLQGSTRRLKKLSRVFDVFLEKIIDDHVEKKERGLDFVDTILGIHHSGDAGFDFDRRHVKAVLLDMLVGGMDTSTVTVEWAFSELIKHPSKMKKLQKELEEVVGLNQMVEESHLSSLKYLDCVIKESMRLHPVAPLLLREAREDCEVGGFRIPKKMRVLVNVWAIGRDPEAWTDPEEFAPERFLESNVDLRGLDFQLIPFGAGRRGCPGMQLGLILVSLMVAQLVHCFDWELPDGAAAPGDLDMSEHFGFVTSKAKHLMVFPSYRLHIFRASITYGTQK